jgi:FkbM family methyltransferase
MWITPRFIDHYVNNTHEDYSADLLLSFSKDQMLFIDVGAHYGFYTLLMGSGHKHSRIIALEPVQENYEVLKRNLEFNQLSFVQAHRVAASSHAGIGKINISEASDNCGFYNHALSRTVRQVEVETATLDSLLSDLPSVPTIVKVDTEGHEIPVLQGMIQILQRVPDIKLLIEFNPKMQRRAGYDARDLLNEINRLGFDIYLVEDQERQIYKLDQDHAAHWHTYVGETQYRNLLCMRKGDSLSVCFFSHSSQLAGAERSLLELVTELIRDYSVICSVVLPSDGPLVEKLQEAGASTLICDYRWWCDGARPSEEEMRLRLNRSFRILREELMPSLARINPDIIVTNTMVIPWGSFAASLLGKPHVWFVREFGNDLKFFLSFQNVLEIIRNSSNAVLTCSKAVKETLFGNKPDEGILPIYSHIDIPSRRLSEGEDKYFEKDDAIKLLILGSITESKGQEDAVLALRELVQRKKAVELIIMGQSDPWYAGELRKTVRNENLENHVKFCDFDENPYPAIEQADVILVCSKMGTGRTSYEAMLLKKPVISTDSGASREFIKEEFNGLLYEPGNYKQLAERIEYLHDNRCKIQELGANGYTFAKEAFPKERFGGKVYELLKKLKGSTNPFSSSYFHLSTSLFEQSLIEKDDMLAQKEQQLAVKEQDLGKLQAQLSQMNQQHQGLQAQLVAKEQQVSALQNQLTSLNHRLRWKRYRMADKLLALYWYTRHPKQVPRLTKAYAWELGRKRLPYLQRWVKRFFIEKEGHHDTGYQEWIRLYDTLIDADREAIRRHIQELGYRPTMSVVMPVYNTPEKWLRIAIESVRNQLYPYWELCIADDASTLPHVRKVLQEYQEKDHRVKVVFRQQNGHISAASNSALTLATGEFITLLDHDDELAEHALYMVVEALNRHPDTDLIYSDEDRVDERGRRYDPYFKSDWNPDLFYSHNLISHLGAYRTSLVRRIEGFRSEFDGSQDYDLALRAIEQTSPDRIRHIPHVLYHWRAVPGSAALNPDQKEYAYDAARRAIRAHFDRRHIRVTVTEASHYSMHRVIYPLPNPPPLVSLIIPTKDKVELLHTCVDGILHHTDYTEIELIIVDNRSEETATLTYLKELQKDSRVRVLKYDAPYNFSAINNMAVREAHGQIIGFVNNDLKVISPGWLHEMVSHAVRPEIGGVGCKLYYPNGTIQHAGVILGLGGIAGHSHRFMKRDLPGYRGRAVVVQNLSAVTATCLLTRRAVFEEVGGFNGEDLQVAFNDVDLCLRTREKGYRILWTPYAELYHIESASREHDLTPAQHPRFERESTFMRSRWGDLLSNDPFYSPNLTLEREDSSLAYPPRVRKPWERMNLSERD